MTKIISIIGMPGAGKTTLAKSLSRRLNIFRLEAGNIARDLAARDPEVAYALARGEMAPREKMNAAMNASISKLVESGMNNEYIVDGYPRYLQQLYDLVFTTSVSGAQLLFIRLNCTNELATSRLMSRQRSDDEKLTIQRRISNFWVETYPMFDSIHAPTCSIDVSSVADIEQITLKATLFLGQFGIV